MLNDDPLATFQEKVNTARHIIKSMKGLELDTIPLLSVLLLHIRRARYLTSMWVDEKFNEDPTDHGWVKGEDGKFSVQLQDESDPFYFLPRKLLISCSCKTECRKCKCKKEEKISGKCSMLTCKNCPCFRRTQETEEEDLALSNQYQQFMDDLSSGSDSEIDLDLIIEAAITSPVSDEDPI